MKKQENKKETTRSVLLDADDLILATGGDGDPKEEEVDPDP